MTIKSVTAVLVVFILIIIGLRFVMSAPAGTGMSTTTPTTTSASILSFEDCMAAGYPVSGANPRQCRLPDGRVYAEEVSVQPTYHNATSDQIRITQPAPGSVTGKTFTISGQARGTWYFEASFPVAVLDKDGKTLVTIPAQAKGDWMTTDFVPYSVQVTVPQSYIGPATIVLHKDNPSGLSENDASMSVPITIEY
jgi:hypothetical protein